jgi:hypothetical protein
LYSQHGEHLIVDKILSYIPDKDMWCCEFGAWDGKHLSNTYYFIENKNYSAVLIEGDIKKFKILTDNFKNNTSIIPINKMVGFNEDNTLDIILKSTLIPNNFDLLSIDIDGDDYKVWETLENYRPKIIIVEYNVSIPDEVEYIQNIGNFIGSSIKSFIKLSKIKNYKLISVTDTNLIFVDNKYKNNLKNCEKFSIETNKKYKSYIFQGYNGSLYLKGNKKQIWGKGKNFTSDILSRIKII